MTCMAIMQPYFFPYIGYFQLVNLVDKFVFYDDVNYIKRGWVNRNRILINHDIKYITVPLLKVSQNKKINETRINSQDVKWKNKIYKTIKNSYSSAPFLKQGLELLDIVLSGHYSTISSLAKTSIRETNRYLDIDKKIVWTSELYRNDQLFGQERIIDICKQESANTYVNLSGGYKLYDPHEFSKNNIDLKFIKSKVTPYKQLHYEFIPNLSVLDVIMMNDVKAVKSMLYEYTLNDDLTV